MQIESEGMVETRRLEYIEWTCEGGSNRHPGVMNKAGWAVNGMERRAHARL